MAAPSLDGMEGRVGRGAAAAELHLLGAVEGAVRVHGPAREPRVRGCGARVVVLMVEGHEVNEGFAGDLAALEKEV